MKLASPYVITRFSVKPIERLAGRLWVVIATADLEIGGTIAVRGLELIEQPETGARRIRLPRRRYDVKIALPLQSLAEVLSAAYDDETVHLIDKTCRHGAREDQECEACLNEERADQEDEERQKYDHESYRWEGDR